MTRHWHAPDSSDAQVYAVDFGMLFPRRCADAEMAGDPGSDFELWSPGGRASECLLGRRVDYVRRKPRARCFVGREPLATIERSCACSASDYQCDFCFERVGEDAAALRNLSAGACVWACEGAAPAGPPSPCYGTYLKSRGFAKIEGDSCRGGLDLTPQRLVCPAQRQNEYGAAAPGAGAGGASGAATSDAGQSAPDVFGVSGWGGFSTGVVAIGAIAACAAASVVFVKGGGGGGVRRAAAGMVLALRRPHSGPGYSRLATSDDNDDFALADDLLAADADDVEPSDL